MSRFAPPTKRRDILLANAMYRATAPDHKRESSPPAPIPPAPIKRRQSVPSNELTEHQHQAAVVQWWGLQGPAWGFPRKALFAIPNGQILMAHADNPQAVMGYLRVEGFRDGMLDLGLAVPSKGYHGWFGELKRSKGGVISPDQAEMILMFEGLGYCAAAYHGAEAMIAGIKRYLGKE